MTQSTRRTIDAALNTNIALKGLQRHATEANLTQRYQLHPEQRKQQLLEPVARTCESGSGKYGAAIMESRWSPALLVARSCPLKRHGRHPSLTRRRSGAGAAHR
ncbi:hypothetical protein ABIG06_001646 [Bradyrhizobium sp. USDA 326]|uniref:hypothetical protein n=1 Tax=Bradyrhizobium sp. USDA 326 TaxID=3377726 RepID=UPI003C7341DE